MMRSLRIHSLRGSLGGCTFRQCSHSLSSLGFLSSRESCVNSTYNHDGSNWNSGTGCLPLWDTGLAFTCAASVADCTGSGSEEHKAALPQPDPSKSNSKVQLNIKDFFKASTAESRAAADDRLRQSMRPKLRKTTQPPPSHQAGRPRQQPSSEIPTQPTEPKPHEITEEIPWTYMWYPYLIKEILMAVELNLGWRGTCTYLQKKFKSGMYNHLVESTVRGWYTKGPNPKLTPSSLALLKSVRWACRAAY